MSPRRRVVVTGMGAVSAAGVGVEAFWDACLRGRSSLHPIERFASGEFGAPWAGEIRETALRNLCRRHANAADGDGAESEPAAAILLEAAAEALASSHWTPRPPPHAAVVIGTCLGGAAHAFRWLRVARESPSEELPSRWIRGGGLSAPTLRLAALLESRGPVVTVSSACTSGTAAVGMGAECIRRGEADVAIVGGVDVLSRFVLSGFWSLRALASETVRPFDRRRDGLALGEGAGVLILEERGFARRREAPCLAEVTGYGSAGDAHHMTGPSPDGDGVVRAIVAALVAAGQRAEGVDFISAHGTGTRYNDRMETIAFKRIFGARASRIPIDSIKPVIGHTLGAAGALEAVLCVKVIEESRVPPTINYAEPDPECDLDYVPNDARTCTVRRALSSSSAFAGHNAALLLEAP